MSQVLTVISSLRAIANVRTSIVGTDYRHNAPQNYQRSRPGRFHGPLDHLSLGTSLAMAGPWRVPFEREQGNCHHLTNQAGLPAVEAPPWDTTNGDACTSVLP